MGRLKRLFASFRQRQPWLCGILNHNIEQSFKPIEGSASAHLVTKSCRWCGYHVSTFISFFNIPADNPVVLTTVESIGGRCDKILTNLSGGCDGLK